MAEQLGNHDLAGVSRAETGGTYSERTTELTRAIGVVSVLDPELLGHEDTRVLVALGAEYGAQVTSHYGTPHRPAWASGAHESGVLMSYHNGGEDGHTSVGSQGAGVPRNTLLIAGAVNDVAGQDVFSPLMRASSFYSAYAHDLYQLCGRSLLPEGQGHGRGDERLSAEDAANRYIAVGGDPVTAEQSYRNVMATAFNPQTSAQNVNYEPWESDPNNPEALQSILGQELTAAADLLGTTRPGGPLGAIQYVAELMCLDQKERIVQQRLQARGIEPTTIASLGQLLDLFNQDTILREVFTETIAGQSKFFTTHLKFSDKVIRQMCGRGVDDLFPGRIANALVLDEYAEALRAGQPARSIWEHAKTRTQNGGVV